MAIICVRGDGSGVVERPAELTALAPRVAVAGGGTVWLDGRGLERARVLRLAERAVGQLERAVGQLERGVGGRWGAGVAAVPVGAYVAGGQALVAGGRVRSVEESVAAYLSPQPLAVLEEAERLLPLLEGVGIERCGELASLPRESVEVRFGPEAVGLWRLARGEDGRRLFRAPERAPTSASLDFVDYVVSDPERLLFTVNGLLATVCGALESHGEHARALVLRLELADGSVWERALRGARPTASRATWLRLARTTLERLTVPDSVAGIAVRVAEGEEAGTVQGDLFDPGFGTAAAVDAAVARLVETQENTLVRPHTDAHPLAERRSTFEATAWEGAQATSPARQPSSSASGDPASAVPPAGLTLQVLPEPRPVRVESEPRRDHETPLRYHDRRWHRLTAAAGPDRISGGQWEDGYAREYFRAVREDGVLVWLFRDARRGRWYLHGWWD
jgi:hypothetical protein